MGKTRLQACPNVVLHTYIEFYVFVPVCSCADMVKTHLQTCPNVLLHTHLKFYKFAHAQIC